MRHTLHPKPLFLTDCDCSYYQAKKFVWQLLSKPLFDSPSISIVTSNNEEIYFKRSCIYYFHIMSFLHGHSMRLDCVVVILKLHPRMDQVFWNLYKRYDKFIYTKYQTFNIRFIIDYSCDILQYIWLVSVRLYNRCWHRYL